MIKSITVRVYACVVKNAKLLVLHEEYAGEKMLKLPGGGLELGEGLHDCLHREFAEELNVKIRILEHLYTQEEFVQSKFREHEQLLTIYYIAEILDEENLKILDPTIDYLNWIDIHNTENPFPLPVDRIAFEKLQQKLR